MNSLQRTQVVIIGAGPTGLSMAAHLLRYNIDFIILEKKEGLTELSKAIAVQARSLELFDELGLAQKAIEEGRITTALNLFHKGKRRLHLDIKGLGEGQTAFPYALSLEQSKTENLLADHLSAHEKRVNWKCEYLRCEETSDHVKVYYRDANGQEQAVEAAYLVGCEGAHSLVRHQLNAGFEGDTIAKLFYVADVVVESPVVNKDELYAFVIRKGFVLFFPMEGKGHYRAVGILPDRTDADFTFKEIEPSIKKETGVPLEFRELKWFSTYKVHSRMASTFMKDRCFIAGDAAHIHTPAGGQGMNTGIQDAYNLAWKLAFVLNGKLKSSVLETYSSERMNNARHLLKTTDRMFDIMAGTNPFRNFIRLHVAPFAARFLVKIKALSRAVFPLISQTGISYPESALTVKSRIGNVKAGDRMPYFLLADGSNVFSHIKAPSFKLLYFGERKDPFEKAIGDLKFKISVRSFQKVPEPIFGNEKDFYILLRPDNHIMYIGKEIQMALGKLDELIANSD